MHAWRASILLSHLPRRSRRTIILLAGSFDHPWQYLVVATSQTRPLTGGRCMDGRRVGLGAGANADDAEIIIVVRQLMRMKMN